MINPASTLFHRFSAERITAALKDTPVVTVIGPRQGGKTTLVREFVDASRIYISLDDDTALAAARNDPAGFVRGLNSAVIDEVQRAPNILRAIKNTVDNDRRPGRFLLTGSADILMLPTISESLAGRMEIIDLLPLSRAEIRGTKPSFLARAFTGKVSKPIEVLIGHDLVQSVLVGGYPEMVRRKDPRRRQIWAHDYVKSIIQRDVRDIAEIERLGQVPRLLRALAHHSGQLTNFSEIGGQIGLDDKTTRKYFAVLEELFLVRRLEPWFRNPLKRMVKSPKLHFLDSGLLASLRGVTAKRITNDRSVLGPLLETFVFSEILKQASWLDEALTIYHYRDRDQDEVDIVAENDSAEVVGIEIKASATVNSADFKGLKKLAQVCGKDFMSGIVLYDGETLVPFGSHLFAAPISCLWE
ncbi:MAG TPA: ATP-binding protein [Candidatus Angelobacter sp.]|nr:ATP-binding protein [Candidatus Angelobacter sp.]